MTLFKNDDTLEISYKLLQAYSYFFHQNKTEITSTITSDTDKVPSVKAVAAYVDSNISGVMDFAAVKGDTTLSVTNETDGLCAVRVTKMSDGSTQYQSSAFAAGKPSNQKTAFTFNTEALANYMIEAWHYDSTNKKLIPTAVKFI